MKGAKSMTRPVIKHLLSMLVVLTILGCHPSVPEMDLFSREVVVRPQKVDLSKCPEKVVKTINRDKDLSPFVEKQQLHCEYTIYRMDLDQNGTNEFICFFRCPNGRAYYLILTGESGTVIAKDGWLEMNKPGLEIVSLVKKGEYEILVKHPGGGAGIETTDITLYKMQGGALRPIFAGDYFRHEWQIGVRDKFEAKYYAVAGNDPPFEIRQYEGELNKLYATMPKNPPNFETVTGGGKPLKVFAWDQAQFKFVEKK